MVILKFGPKMINFGRVGSFGREKGTKRKKWQKFWTGAVASLRHLDRAASPCILHRITVICKERRRNATFTAPRRHILTKNYEFRIFDSKKLGNAF